jgi:uncharacterized membrane protein YccC
MRAASLGEWIRAKDPGLVAVKRAVRVTLAACVAFYFSLYLLDNTQMATFASFGCIALGALSDVRGAPWQRTKTYAVALLAGIVLVTLGTLLAVNTWAAVAGMLVIGFAIAYAGVGGPRVVGAANGLQLLYILPSFPPYMPEALGSRLIGLVLAVGALAIADRLIWPPPVPTPFRERLADAIQVVRRRLVTLLGTDGDRQAHGELNDDHAISLRLSRIPPLERPTGPGKRDRAAMHAATLIRGLEARVGVLAELTDESRGAATHAIGVQLLNVTARSLSESAEALDGPRAGHTSDPDPAPVEAALSRYVLKREAIRQVSEVDEDVRFRLRFAVAAEEFTNWTRDLAVAVRIMHGKPVPKPPTTSIAEPFWYANRSTLTLWFMRFWGHFTPRSVFFQNAVRLAVGLAAARLIAGVLDLSHGFWMLLATLTLMRTSVATTRAAVVPAFLGTVAGGLVAALVLTLAGGNSVVYEVAFPFVMVIALMAGPLAGAAAGQALFTLLVAMLFAQMAPVSWRLAEVRILDVVLGGLLGAIVGLLVWPRGAEGEMRRAAKVTLQAAADDLESTVRSSTDREVAASEPDTAAVAVRYMLLADSTYAQYRSELSSAPDPVDWISVIGLVQEVVGGGQVLRRTHGMTAPLPWPSVAADLERYGESTANEVRAVADVVSQHASGSQTAIESGDVAVEFWVSSDAAREVVRRETDPASAVRVLDIWGWLTGISHDSRRVADSVTHPTESR